MGAAASSRCGHPVVHRTVSSAGPAAPFGVRAGAAGAPSALSPRRRRSCLRELRRRVCPGEGAATVAGDPKKIRPRRTVSLRLAGAGVRAFPQVAVLWQSGPLRSPWARSLPRRVTGTGRTCSHLSRGFESRRHRNRPGGGATHGSAASATARAIPGTSLAPTGSGRRGASAFPAGGDRGGGSSVSGFPVSGFPGGRFPGGGRRRRSRRGGWSWWRPVRGCAGRRPPGRSTFRRRGAPA